MAVHEILKMGDPRLLRVAQPVAEFGTPGLKALIADTGADELMTTGQIYDHAARLRSFEIAAEVRDRLAKQPAM